MTWVQMYLQFIVDILHYAAWPAVVILTLIYFSKPLGRLIDRLIGFEGRGLKFDTTGMPQNPPKTTDSSVDELMKAFDSPILTKQEQQIETELEKSDIQIDTNKKIQILTRHLAVTQIKLIFAQIDTYIYGSQVALLQFLNTQAGLPKERLKTFYDIAASKNPAFFQRYQYEQYLTFLINCGLIIETDGNLSITLLGVEFLSYLTRVGRSEPTLRFG